MYANGFYNRLLFICHNCYLRVLLFDRVNSVQIQFCLKIKRAQPKLRSKNTQLQVFCDKNSTFQQDRHVKEVCIFIKEINYTQPIFLLNKNKYLVEFLSQCDYIICAILSQHYK